ncbi:hypothetical protein CSIM01_04089 [Colletotrichum simmondsii]|uniref:MYND-type domain-containing protein n=1 Tax=Colletotrichum simmondsii TaxID=703756 RepID=A0A135S6B2_9PEZI|nr:hypothetical protein CSIM01_04089 [Colletotrichum simmondsii]
MPNYDEFGKEFFYLPEFLQADDQDEVAENGGAYRNTTNWCLFGEIVRIELITRLVLVCRDKRDFAFLVAFYPDGNAQADPRPYEVGHTVAVLNTTTKRFLDGREGVRVEKLETCRVSPAFSLLISINGGLLTNVMNTELVKYTGRIDEQRDTRPCQACGKEAQERKKCGGCGYYYYCDTACQKMAWEGKHHKKECKVLKNPNMRMLLNLKAATQALRFTD